VSDVTKEEGRRLESMISVRLAPDEDARVRAEAAKRGVSVSSFLRSAALGRCDLDVEILPINQTDSSSTVGAGIAFDLGDDGHMVARPVVGAYVNFMRR
jgi:hypothetical protein